MVDDGTAAHFEQWFGGGERQRPEAFAAAPRHQHGIERERGMEAPQVEHFRDPSLFKHRQQVDAPLARLGHHFMAGRRFFNAHEIAVHEVADTGLEIRSAQYGAAYVSVGDCALHPAVVADGEEGHRVARQTVDSLQGIA